MEGEQTQSQLGYECETRQPHTIPSDGKSVAAATDVLPYDPSSGPGRWFPSLEQADPPREIRLRGRFEPDGFRQIIEESSAYPSWLRASPRRISACG